MKLGRFCQMLLPNAIEMHNLFYYVPPLGILVLEENLETFIRAFKGKIDFNPSEAEIQDQLNALKDRLTERRYILSTKLGQKPAYLVIKASKKLHKAFQYVSLPNNLLTAPKPIKQPLARPSFEYTENLLEPKDKLSIARITVGREEYVVSTHAFNRFCERLPTTFMDRKKNKNREFTQTEFLELFTKLFVESIQAKRVNARQQAAVHGERAKYRINENLIFVSSTDKVIKTCYWKEEAIPYEV